MVSHIQNTKNFEKNFCGHFYMILQILNQCSIKFFSVLKNTWTEQWQPTYSVFYHCIAFIKVLLDKYHSLYKQRAERYVCVSYILQTNRCNTHHRKRHRWKFKSCIMNQETTPLLEYVFFILHTTHQTC